MIRGAYLAKLVLEKFMEIDGQIDVIENDNIPVVGKKIVSGTLNNVEVKFDILRARIKVIATVTREDDSSFLASNYYDLWKIQATADGMALNEDQIANGIFYDFMEDLKRP